MSLGSENGLSVADIAAVTDRNNNGNCSGWGGGFGEMLIAMIMLFLFPMFFGGGMWGGMGGFGGGWGGNNAGLQGALTRADLCSEFNFNGLENAVRGVTQGLCDGFYAMQGAINGLGTTVMQGFSQSEIADGQRHAALMQQLYQMGYDQKNCCCETKTSIMQLGNQMERGFCQAGYNDQENTTAIIQNAHNDTDRVLAKLDAMEMSRKDERIAQLEQAANQQQLAAALANERAATRAMIDASTAEILRRSGHDCPSAAYIVQPPTPVNFPTNCCGQFSGWGNNGCGQGCGGCC